MEISSSSIQLRFLTLNIFLRPPLIKSNDSDYKQSRTRYFVRNIMPHYDVICLQEVFRKMNGRAKKLIKGARKHGLTYYLKSPRSSESKVLVDGGLLILSRYPIVDAEFVPYVEKTFPDSPASCSCVRQFPTDPVTSRFEQTAISTKNSLQKASRHS